MMRALSTLRLPFHLCTRPRQDFHLCTRPRHDILSCMIPRRTIHTRTPVIPGGLIGSLSLTEEVQEALYSGRPVVALESTIITHGLPQPENLSTALGVEAIIRDHGAIPATVALMAGKIHVGLSGSQIEQLAAERHAVKSSRRDLPFVLSQGLTGGTTVAGTMIAARMAGIHTFVTGGIGGVHRGAEHSMDISADLRELSRTPVAVVCAGVKSILDIGRTLEYLETEGVCVATYGADREFPAFFSRKSGFLSPYSFSSASQAAQVIATSLSVDFGSGVLIGIPIPREFEEEGEAIEACINSAVQEARDKSITGPAITPYILARVNELTAGRSLVANVALVKNNAAVGAQIACELSQLWTTPSSSQVSRQRSRSTGRQQSPGGGHHGSSPPSASSHTAGTCSMEKPVVVGCTNVDFIAKVHADQEQLQTNGGVYPGKVSVSFGGVGRNIADCLTHLGCTPQFVSLHGQDMYGQIFRQHCSHMDLSYVSAVQQGSTATYCAVLQKDGELMYGIGDCDIHNLIDKQHLSQYESVLAEAPLVVMDGNIHPSAMSYITDVCHNNEVPVWFEPTDLGHSQKVFESEAYKRITYISPNINELREFNACAQGKPSIPHQNSNPEGSLEETLSETVELVKPILKFIPVIVVTLGEYGILLCCREDGPLPTRPSRQSQEPSRRMSTAQAYHYPIQLVAPDPPVIGSVSGGGDCLVAGILAGLLRGASPHQCMVAGLLAARLSVQSYDTVPNTMAPQLIDQALLETKARPQPTLLTL